MRQLVNLGVRTTVEERAEIRAFARSQGLTLQRLVADAVRDYLKAQGRAQGRVEWPSMPPLSASGRQLLVLLANILTRLQETDPAFVAIKMYLITAALDLDPKVGRRRPAVSIEEPFDASEYVSLALRALRGQEGEA